MTGKRKVFNCIYCARPVTGMNPREIEVFQWTGLFLERICSNKGIPYLSFYVYLAYKCCKS